MAKEMTKEELIKLLQDKKVESERLDGIVHETASITASDINNMGLDAQVEYLLEQGVYVEIILAEAGVEG